MVQATSLLFLLTDTEILLAMKKRGFGTGRYNGVGGKPEPDETLQQTTIRECQEEIGVTPQGITPVALLTFHVHKSTNPVDIQCHVYVCRSWQGQPIETDEMAPQWFAQSAIPYNRMWAADTYWLPEVLKGNFVTASFTLDAAEQVTSQHIAVTPR